MPTPSTATRRRRRPAFHIAGFPVHVRPGFLVFMALVVLLNGDSPSFGLWLAGLMAAFTLLHELGHALAARAADCRAEISLDFLAGYAAFVPSRPLRPWERAAISLAGPAVQIVAGLVVFVAVGGDLGWPLRSDTAAQYAAVWAGPVIGVFNLAPILPFDGGHVLQVVVERFAPARARSIMYAFTIGVSALTILFMVARPEWRSFAIFAVIPLMSVLQMRTTDKEIGRSVSRRASHAAAEAAAWATDDLSAFAGTDRVPSPWYRAWQQLRAGHAHVARDILVADLAETRDVDWSAPDTAPVDTLSRLAGLVPRPVPQGRTFSMYVLCEILLRTGSARDAGLAAAESFRLHRAPLMALVVARAAASLGDRTAALQWLATAAEGTEPFTLRASVDASPELAVLRGDPELARILD
ncbi:MAG: metalloprotease [Ilumatobacteraceae bacterium]